MWIGRRAGASGRVGRAVATGSGKPTSASPPGGLLGEPPERGDVRLEEMVLEVQILRRVSRQAELRADDQAGARAATGGDRLGDQRRVAVEVADRRVELREGDR